MGREMEINEGYKITNKFQGEYVGYVIGYNEGNVAPYVVWRIGLGNAYVSGTYFSSKENAYKLYLDKIKTALERTL